jgi:hypothetical protein
MNWEPSRTRGLRRCEIAGRSSELLHDGCPVACLGDAPFGYVNVFTSHVNVGFFHGAALPDPACLLQGTATNAAALSRLIDMAYSQRNRARERRYAFSRSGRLRVRQSGRERRFSFTSFVTIKLNCGGKSVCRWRTAIDPSSRFSTRTLAPRNPAVDRPAPGLP